MSKMAGSRTFNLAFALLLIALVGAAVNAVDPCKNKCTDFAKCPGEGDTAFATDGKYCHVFDNTCRRYVANCHRENLCLERLKDLSKEECQKLCVDNCSAEHIKVCGGLNGQIKSFANECELRKLGCQKIESWELLHDIEC